MKVKIEGWYDLESLKKTICQALDLTVEQFKPIKQFSGVNLYFTPRDEQGKQIGFMDEGEIIDEVICIHKKKEPKPKLKRVK